MYSVTAAKARVRHRDRCHRVPGRLPVERAQCRTLRCRTKTRRSEGDVVARFVVDVMLKPEILDSQGQAVARALPRLGFEGVTGVRQGKRFEIELAGPADESATERVRKMAETLLANPVIETFELRAE